MPPRQSELPEGTDHIITGAMETGTGGVPASGGGGGGSFVAAGPGDDTGGTANDEDRGGPIRDGIASLKQQATDRARQFADDGKTRASDALDEISRAMEEVAETIEDRLGGEYAGYARRGAGAVSTFATTLRERDVDDLYEDAQEFVRKSPAVAIGVAAAAGFLLVRLIKAGLPNEEDEAQGGTAPQRRTRKRSGSGA